MDFIYCGSPLSIVLKNLIEFHFVSNLNVFMAFVSFQETQDPSAVLWLDEIQDAILRANQDTQEALLCKHAHTHTHKFIIHSYSSHTGGGQPLKMTGCNFNLCEAEH